MKLPKLPSMEIDKIINFQVAKSWGINEPQRFIELMQEAATLVLPGIYMGDNLFTWGRNNSLFDDIEFRNAWEKNIRNDADQAIAWRRYILACSGYHCLQVDGDFVECGAYQGSGVKTVMDYLGGVEFPKTFWVYDTFDFNPVDGHAFEGQEAGFFEKVRDRFDGYRQIRLVKGLLPDSFDDACPRAIAYLHIDLNNAEYEISVLDRLFDKVTAGGLIILDDYEWAGIYRKQKLAEDRWFESRDYRVFPLPTGQGLVIKR